MSSDEDDYMSEKFLSKCIPDKNDFKPGLIKSRNERRHHELMKRKNERENEVVARKSMKSSEEERREQKLQEPIGNDNKGFSLLQKMGYKPGQSIGKKDGGRLEPIPISIKTDRFGLGRETVLKEILEIKAKKMIEKQKKYEKICNVEEYRKRAAEKAQEKYIKADLYKSQKICEKLDKTKNIDSPIEEWFWPIDEEDDADTESEESEINFEPSEQLAILTEYLRKCHLYCIWCGMQFENHEDLETNCPGIKREDH